MRQGSTRVCARWSVYADDTMRGCSSLGRAPQRSCGGRGSSPRGPTHGACTSTGETRARGGSTRAPAERKKTAPPPAWPTIDTARASIRRTSSPRPLATDRIAPGAAALIQGGSPARGGATRSSVRTCRNAGRLPCARGRDAEVLLTPLLWPAAPPRAYARGTAKAVQQCNKSSATV